MGIRTDLAIELAENKENGNGIKTQTKKNGDITVTETEIINEVGERELNRKKGIYITVEFPSIYKITDYKALENEITLALDKVIPKNRENVLIVGLGNTDITPDSIGPFTVKGILATRHIAGQFAESIGLKGLKSVSVIAPGVLGQTGIEVGEIIRGTAEKIKPDLIIAVDALAAKSTDRLFKTVQLSNTGISPGSGVKNARKELSYDTLGVPVVAVGVPTVVDAEVLAYEITGKETEKEIDMFVTPKEVDMLADRISEILAKALNVFLQPEIEEEILLSLT